MCLGWLYSSGWRGVPPACLEAALRVYVLLHWQLLCWPGGPRGMAVFVQLQVLRVLG